MVSDDEQQKQAHKPKRKWIKKSKFQRIQKQKRKQRISVVFNYSSVKLTSGMEKVLNRGLNFAILPLKLNITQVLVDFSRFERTMLWHEFWGNSPKQDYKPPIFKKEKNNLPKNHPTPSGLKTFLNAVKSEIEDPQNRNKARPNQPPDEIEGLRDLIRVQKERKITIKPCDKGAGIIILEEKSSQDPYLAGIFPLPPLVAYRRPPNLKDKLIRAKVPEPAPLRPKGILLG